jgi:hypothetical protein
MHDPGLPGLWRGVPKRKHRDWRRPITREHLLHRVPNGWTGTIDAAGGIETGVGGGSSFKATGSFAGKRIALSYPQCGGQPVVMRIRTRPRQAASVGIGSSSLSRVATTMGKAQGLRHQRRLARPHAFAGHARRAGSTRRLLVGNRSGQQSRAEDAVQPTILIFRGGLVVPEACFQRAAPSHSCCRSTMSRYGPFGRRDGASHTPRFCTRHAGVLSARRGEGSRARRR